jgi:hypothetical protein
MIPQEWKKPPFEKGAFLMVILAARTNEPDLWHG